MTVTTTWYVRSEGASYSATTAEAGEADEKWVLRSEVDSATWLIHQTFVAYVRDHGEWVEAGERCTEECRPALTGVDIDRWHADSVRGVYTTMLPELEAPPTFDQEIADIRLRQADML